MSNNGSKNSKKRYLKRCPDCDEFGMSLIIRNTDIDGVIYSKKYWYCNVCEYEKEYRLKNENRKIEFDE